MGFMRCFGASAGVQTHLDLNGDVLLPPPRFRAETESKRSGVFQGLVTDGVLLLSEGPGSSPGVWYLSRGSLCGGIKLGAEGGGGEPGLPRLTRCSLPGE